MLPITHHRAFHVPHSLATVAAIAALVTALSWQPGKPEITAQGDTEAAESSEIAVHSEPAPSESAAKPRRGGGQAPGTALSDLLPLVLPGSPTR